MTIRSNEARIDILRLAGEQEIERAPNEIDGVGSAWVQASKVDARDGDTVRRGRAVGLDELHTTGPTVLFGEAGDGEIGHRGFVVAFGSSVPIQSKAFANHVPSSSGSLRRLSGTDT